MSKESEKPAIYSEVNGDTGTEAQIAMLRARIRGPHSQKIGLYGGNAKDGSSYFVVVIGETRTIMTEREGKHLLARLNSLTEILYDAMDVITASEDKRDARPHIDC